MIRMGASLMLPAAFLVATCCGSSRAAGEESPARAGIAAKYPLDAGIEKDPGVIMVEDYESDDWLKKWQENASPERKVIETDPQIVQNGKRCLKHIFKNEYDKGGAGWMHHWWDGSDVAYLRYYFRLSKGGDWSNQKLFQLHGHQRGQRYGTGAGNRPTGYDWFCSGTGVGSKDWKNTGPPWTNIMLYTYFPGQKGGYGDNVMPNKGIQPGIPEGEWVCYEVMIKLNDVGKTNGEQRLWIDGKLVIEQTEMEWRKAENLVINNVMLATYTHTPPEPGKERYFWLDSIVLARDYIGPMSRPAAPAPAPAKAKTGEGAATPPPAALDEKALAEREAGQQDVAKKLCSQIVEKYPGTEAAGKAKVKLE